MHHHSSRTAAFAAVAFLASLVHCQAYPRLEHWSQDEVTRVLQNNSFIDRSFIDENGDDGVLRCVTDNPTCCSGNWFDSSGEIIPPRDNNANVSFYTTERLVDGHSVHSLKYRSGGSTLVGVFRCDIPNLFGDMESLFVYIGSNAIGEGTLRTIKISYARHPLYQQDYQVPNFILSCVSEGGPVSRVQWWRDRVPVQEDGNHVVSQIILDTSQNAVYDSRLAVWGREGGEYRCRVSNNIPDYYPRLTYLSHNSSYITIDVAERPRNVEHVRASPTSLIVYWLPPRTTPLAYVIFYNLTGEVYSVTVNASRTSTTQSYELGGLSEGMNYSISMVALSRHLPSPVVGSPIMSVADFTPSVTVTTSPGDPVAGSSYVLTCTVTIIPGVSLVPVIEWSGYGIGIQWVTTGRTVSGDDSHTRQVTFRPLVLAHGGAYTCTARFTLNEVTSRDGVDQTLLSVIIPPPWMSVGIARSTIPYVGNNVTLECLVQLDEAVSNSEVEMEVRWVKAGRRTAIPSLEAVIPPDKMRSTISFTNLLETDSGSYECGTTLTPRDTRVNSSPLNTPKIYNLTAIVPSLIIETSPSVVRILDVPPYNQFTLSCTIWAEVYGEKIPLPLTIDWIKRVESGSNVRFSPVASEDPHLSPNPADGYHSILRGSETNSVGSTSYRCRASFVRDAGGATELETSNSLVAVVGPTSPVVPVSVRTTASDNNSLTIQWEITSVSYTPETYHVEYGADSIELGSHSPEQESGPDIRIVDQVYSQDLVGLQPLATYYYRVVASNTAGTTPSIVRAARTMELLRIEGSGDPRVGERYSLECVVSDQSDSGDYTSLTWTDSHGEDLTSDTSGSLSSLELVFESLDLSNVGNYTCTVTFPTGDSRQLTELVLAAVPSSHVVLEEVDQPRDGILYSGLNHTLKCHTNVSVFSAPFVTVSIRWLRDGHGLENCSDLVKDSETRYHCLLTLTHLSHSSDNGSYSCRAVMAPTANYPLLRATSVTSNTLHLRVAIPVVSVTISSSTTRVLDVPPYNQFECSCSASVSVPGLGGEQRLARRWQWTRKGVGEEDFSSVPHFTVDSSWSSVLHSETRSGTVAYQCVYSLEGVDQISASDQITTSVIGAREPSRPVGVAVSQITSSGFVLQWTVESIAYTPETYVVEYSTTSDYLNPAVESVASGEDIGVVDKTYIIELKGLVPGTKYHFVVVAINSARITKTEPLFIYTKETVPGKVSFVSASRVNDSSLNISWGAVEAANGNLTHYLVWVNSSSDGHRRLVDISLPRRLIVSGLRRKTVYKVYVAGVNGAGEGEWQETQDRVTTQGLESSDNSGGGVGLAVGVTLGAIICILILISLLLLLLVVCVRQRRRRRKGHALIISEDIRSSSALLNNTVKEEEDKSSSRSPASPQSNGETASGAAEETGGGGDGENGEERESGGTGGGVEEGTEGGDDGERGDEGEGGSEGGEGGKDGGEPDATTTDSDDDSASKEKASAPATDSNIDEHMV